MGSEIPSSWLDSARDLGETVLRWFVGAWGLLSTNELALGIVIGILVNGLGLLGLQWWKRPRLRIVPKDMHPSKRTIPYQGAGDTSSRPEEVTVWQLKVENRGRSAAENIKAMVLSGSSKAGRRIVWHESPGNAVTLNRRDYSYLELCGVKIIGRGAVEVCFPASDGWSKPVKGLTIESPMTLEVLVTGANCAERRGTFFLDPASLCAGDPPVFR